MLRDMGVEAEQDRTQHTIMLMAQMDPMGTGRITLAMFNVVATGLPLGCTFVMN